MPSNVTILDTYPVPSAQSAGNDLNKIMGVRPRNETAHKLEPEALDMWQNDQLFKAYFHNTGLVRASSISRPGHNEADDLSLIVRHQRSN
jgi:hypothetical protein